MSPYLKREQLLSKPEKVNTSTNAGCYLAAVFFNTLFGAAESNPGLFTLSVLAPGRSGARANQIRSA